MHIIRYKVSQQFGGFRIKCFRQQTSLWNLKLLKLWELTRRSADGWLHVCNRYGVDPSGASLVEFPDAVKILPSSELIPLIYPLPPLRLPTCLPPTHPPPLCSVCCALFSPADAPRLWMCGRFSGWSGSRAGAEQSPRRTWWENRTHPTILSGWACDFCSFSCFRVARKG